MNRMLIQIGLERKVYDYRYDYILKNEKQKDQLQQITHEWNKYRKEKGSFVSFNFKKREFFYDFAGEACKLQEYGIHTRKIHVKSFLIDHDFINIIRNCVKNSESIYVFLNNNLWADESCMILYSKGKWNINEQFVFYDPLVITEKTSVTFKLGSFLFRNLNGSDREKKKYTDFLTIASRENWLHSSCIVIRIGMLDTYYQEIFEILKNDDRGYMKKLLKIQI